MKENKIIPMLRFTGFDAEWDVKIFDKLYSFKKTNSFPRDKLNYQSGKAKNIHYGDIHTKFRTLFDINHEIVPYINENVDLERIQDECYLNEGDLVIADASEDYNDIGKCIEIINLNNEKVLAGLHTFLARKVSSYTVNGFVSFLLQTYKTRLEIMKIAQGTKVLSISSSRLGKIKLLIPHKTEQLKIVSFLTAIEQRLYALQAKETLLESYKKGVIQQLFKQNIRFKDEQGNDFPVWKEKKLGEVLFEHKLKNTGNKFSEVFSVSKSKGVINQIAHLGRSYSAESIEHYKITRPFDVIYTKSPTSDFPFGIIKQNLTGRTGVLSPLYAVFTPENRYVGTILHNYFLSSINTYNYLVPLVQKGAKNTMNINNDDFLDGTKISLPTDEREQQQIASFLSSIDIALENVRQQISKTQDFKKGLLQKMFV